MSKWLGNKISVEIFGTSHGEEIGVKCENFPKIRIDKEKLLAFMKRRQGGQGLGSTPRKECDLPEFTLGVSDGVITDGNFTAVIKNENKKSSDYNELYGKPRPSHADYCDYVKNGTLDYRGGGRFSARLTAPICVAGFIAKEYLNSKGINAHAYISSVGKVNGKSYKRGVDRQGIENIVGFPSLSNKKKMEREIYKALKSGDSVGATCECVLYGLDAGVGDDYFDGLEGKIASLLYAIPAVKGVEFGLGFELSKGYGSKMNDAFYFDGEMVKTKTNNSGGINGGISNGMPVTFRVAFRPTPSISKEQESIDLIDKTNVKIKIKGRHDACVAVRALPIIESMVYLALLDLGV